MCTRGGEVCYTRGWRFFYSIAEKIMNLYRLFKCKSDIEGILQFMSNNLKEVENELKKLKKQDLNKERTYLIIADSN